MHKKKQCFGTAFLLPSWYESEKNLFTLWQAFFPYAKVHLSFPFCFVMPLMIMVFSYEKK